MSEKLTCTQCEEPPLVRHMNDDDVWEWLCLDHSAALGYPLAVQLKTTKWLEGKLERVTMIEGVQ